MGASALTTQCCIAGGGPAGMMLGLLLARVGVEVIVLEKHRDFLRDFRGDTIHPSTLQIMNELGMLDDFLKLPHQETRVLKAQIGDRTFPLADFTHLPGRCGFIAFMPQWDFLNFVAQQGARYAKFGLRMSAEVTGLIDEAGRIAGVYASTPAGPLEVRAALVVGADGRHSIVRDRAGLTVKEFGAPVDVLWFRLSRVEGDPSETIGRVDAGRFFVLINRSDHWQCGYVIAKGSFDDIRARGLPAFRESVARLAPFARGRTNELCEWDDIKLLTVQVDRLTQWYRAGLLCIGDAAHAMSPVGGVGINLAIQDAVAAANLLAAPVRDNRLSIDDLRRVQQRREMPTRITQRVQMLIQNRVIRPVLAGTGPLSAPLAIRLLAAIPLLRRLPARLIGIGVRPEHVRGQSAG